MGQAVGIAIAGSASVTFCNVEVFSRCVEDLFYVQLVQGYGETEAASGPPDRVYNTGFTQLEKNLFEEDLRYLFFFGEDSNGNRSAVPAQFGKGQRSS